VDHTRARRARAISALATASAVTAITATITPIGVPAPPEALSALGAAARFWTATDGALVGLDAVGDGDEWVVGGAGAAAAPTSGPAREDGTADVGADVDVVGLVDAIVDAVGAWCAAGGSGAGGGGGTLGAGVAGDGVVGGRAGEDVRTGADVVDGGGGGAVVAGGGSRLAGLTPGLTPAPKAQPSTLPTFGW
jgi:hypothetical protein